jgi:hypothetical protein
LAAALPLVYLIPVVVPPLVYWWVTVGAPTVNQFLDETLPRKQVLQRGEAPAREADLTPGKSLEAGGELSTEDAVEDVRKGGDVIAKDRSTARDIARRAGGGEPIHEQPGPRAGPSGKPHYHPATPSGQRLPGHVFY